MTHNEQIAENKEMDKLYSYTNEHACHSIWQLIFREQHAVGSTQGQQPMGCWQCHEMSPLQIHVWICVQVYSLATHIATNEKQPPRKGLDSVIIMGNYYQLWLVCRATNQWIDVHHHYKYPCRDMCRCTPQLHTQQPIRNSHPGMSQILRLNLIN